MALGSTSVPSASRDAMRRTMVTTLFGRLAGFDSLGYEVGEQDTRLPIDNIGTTVPTSCSPNGFTNFSCTVASSATHTMNVGVAGIYKTLTQISSSTLGIVVQFGSAANIVTSAGSSFNQITFAGVGHTAGLACVSSSTANGPIWLCSSPASPGLTFSTF